MINWEPLLAGHIRGTCARGLIWIRLTPENRVSGVYLIFEGREKEKWVPRTAAEEELAWARRWAEDQLLLLEMEEELTKK